MVIRRPPIISAKPMAKFQFPRSIMNGILSHRRAAIDWRGVRRLLADLGLRHLNPRVLFRLDWWRSSRVRVRNQRLVHTLT
jgi:hypothetical protein